jgi:3-methyladenine DNA glycosylase AlkD
MTLLKNLRRDLRDLADPTKAMVLQRFFKTGKGQYGEGDKFLGIVVPKQRTLAKTYYQQLTLADLKDLLNSAIHEERLLALLILVMQYQKGDAKLQQKIYDFYFANISAINNWDLVDLSAPQIVGAHLLDKNRDILHKLVTNERLWLRRIAIVATQTFIRNNSFQDTLLLAKKLLNDREDLMHKATGWMLREVGKRDQEQLEKFLIRYYQSMPRTMLRYAIERFPEKLRQNFLQGKVKVAA